MSIHHSVGSSESRLCSLGVQGHSEKAHCTGHRSRQQAMFSLRRHTLLNTRQSRDHWTGLKMAARRTQINPPQVCVTPESLSHEVRQQLNRSSLRGGMCLIPFWNCPAKTCAMPNPGGAQPHTSERVDHRGSQVYTPIVLTARSNLDPTESMQETLVRCLHIQTNKFYRETGHLQI